MKFNIVETSATDKTLETKGAEFVWEGYKFLVSRYNTDYIKAVQEEMLTFADIKDVKEEVVNKKLAELVATHLLQDWQGIEDADTGEPIKANKSNKVKVLEAIPDLLDAIDAFARKRDNFKKARMEAQAKN